MSHPEAIRRFVVVLSLAAAACGIIALLVAAEPDVSAGSSPRTHEVEGGSDSLNISGPRLVGNSRSRPAGLARSDAPKQDDDAGVAIETRRSKGRIRYENGEPPKSFRFRLSHLGRRCYIHGKDGEFSYPSHIKSPYRISSLEADDIEAVLLSAESDPSTDYCMEIVLVTPQPRELLITDAESGSAVSDAIVYESWDSERMTSVAGVKAWLPGPRAYDGPVVRGDSLGRVLLPSSAGSGSWLVGAPGYSWRRVRIQAGSMSRVRVRLNRGGTLHVSVPGWNEEKELTFLVSLKNEFPNLVEPLTYPEVKGDAASARIEGLPLGEVYVAVVTGHALSSHRRVLAKGSARVTAGESARLTLHLQERQLKERGDLVGTVDVGSGWDVDTGPIEIYLHSVVDEQSRAYRERVPFERDGETLRFSCASLPIGNYDVLVMPMHWGCRVRVREGPNSVRMSIPDPVNVRVEVASDHDRPLSRATVRCIGDSSTEGVISRIVARQLAKPGSFEFKAPAAKLIIHVSAPGYESHTREIDASHRFTNPIEIRLRASASIRVKISCQGRAISVNGVRARATNESGKVRSAIGMGGVLLIEELEPGKWTINPLVLDGFLPSSPQDVFVRRGESTTVSIHLDSDE